MAEKNGWQLNKAFLIVMIILNLGGIIWGAATLAGRVDINEKWIEENKALSESVHANERWIEENKESVKEVPLLCERFKHICEALDEIKQDVKIIKRQNGWRDRHTEDSQ